MAKPIACLLKGPVAIARDWREDRDKQPGRPLAAIGSAAKQGTIRLATMRRIVLSIGECYFTGVSPFNPDAIRAKIQTQWTHENYVTPPPITPLSPRTLSLKKAFHSDMRSRALMARFELVF